MSKKPNPTAFKIFNHVLTESDIAAIAAEVARTSKELVQSKKYTGTPIFLGDSPLSPKDRLDIMTKAERLVVQLVSTNGSELSCITLKGKKFSEIDNPVEGLITILSPGKETIQTEDGPSRVAYYAGGATYEEALESAKNSYAIGIASQFFIGAARSHVEKQHNAPDFAGNQNLLGRHLYDPNPHSLIAAQQIAFSHVDYNCTGSILLTLRDRENSSCLVNDIAIDIGITYLLKIQAGKGDSFDAKEYTHSLFARAVKNVTGEELNTVLESYFGQTPQAIPFDKTVLADEVKRLIREDVGATETLALERIRKDRFELVSRSLRIPNCTDYNLSPD